MVGVDKEINKKDKIFRRFLIPSKLSLMRVKSLGFRLIKNVLKKVGSCQNK